MKCAWIVVVSSMGLSRFVSRIRGSSSGIKVGCFGCFGCSGCFGYFVDFD